MSWKPVAYMPLHIQQPAAIQRGLFAAARNDMDDLPPVCDHAVTEPQASMFGGTDDVCVVCGARRSKR